MSPPLPTGRILSSLSSTKHFVRVTRMKPWTLFLIVYTASTLWTPTASNTVLLPVPTSPPSQEEDASSPSRHDSYAPSSSSSSNSPRPSFAPSASLRLDDGATYWIRSGHHPRISFPSIEDFQDVEIRVRYFHKRDKTIVVKEENGDDDADEYKVVDFNYVETTNHHDVDGKSRNDSKEYFQVDDCPRHFLWLSDQAVEAELQHRITHGTWRERVLVEKLYFTLFYGGTGLATKYMDLVDDFQTDLEGWNVMDHNRTTTNRNDHCSWEGVDCDDDKNIIGFSIHGFSLEGTLPTDLYLMTSLKHLDLKGNLIRGSLPSSWGKMTSLVTLNMADNELSGIIPTSFSQLTNLKKLWLGSNHFKGTISDSFIQSWSNLELLDLSSNQFSGTIPQSLVKKSKHLKNLYLQSNHLSGTIPPLVPKATSEGFDPAPGASSSDFAALGDLQVIDLGDNQLVGTIPLSWFSLTELREWNLQGNDLTGSLPRDVWSMSHLEVLTLVSAATTNIKDWLISNLFAKNRWTDHPFFSLSLFF